MKFIEELREGETITEHYLCKQKKLLKSKAGKNYISLRLYDKTGLIDGKIWEINSLIQDFNEGDFVKVEAFVTSFNGDLQFNIRRLRRSQKGEYNPQDFVPTTKYNIEDLFDEFTNFIDTIKTPYFRELLENIFIANDEMADEFKVHSAAKSMHHSYMGGLLEHTLSVTKLCDKFAEHYKGRLNRDLLITSAMLHDVCKIYELSPFPDNDYTDCGQLLGHIVMGAELVSREAKKIPDFPEEAELLLKHCILSHHGEFDFGSPKLPSTAEAYLLHCADDTDAKMNMFIEMADNNKTNGSWLGYNNILGRNIRRSEL
ncbi:MAG: HD domain-containing protein [Clostridiales bacterium]|nr:HD domain-containing protein [Clostridiales bacterium]